MSIDATVSQALRQAIAAQMPAAFNELAEIVAIASVADPRLYPAEECLRAARWVADKLEQAGLSASLHETPDGTQAVLATSPPVDGAPTVLLYCHYDVQPPLDAAAWHTEPFTLTEANGRWFGRGAADCKGNILAHLLALRAFEGQFPLNITVIAEGSEEQGTGGLERWVPEHPQLIDADVMLICDAGNIALGVPTITTVLRGVADAVIEVRALEGELHSGMFGGAAPDALLALIKILASMRDDEGNTTIDGLDATAVWSGAQYPPEQFRADAAPVAGASLLGSGTPSDMLWARPALTVLGIDAPPVVGCSASIPPTARALVNLRIPPGVDPAAAHVALAAHVRAAAPWGVEVTVTPDGEGAPFSARTDGPAFAALSEAMAEAFGSPTTTAGIGGSIPLTGVLQNTIPQAEIVILGVAEPSCKIHAPNESVDPAEIQAIALSEALFLASFTNPAAQ